MTKLTRKPELLTKAQREILETKRQHDQKIGNREEKIGGAVLMVAAVDLSVGMGAKIFYENAAPFPPDTAFACVFVVAAIFGLTALSIAKGPLSRADDIEQTLKRDTTRRAVWTECQQEIARQLAASFGENRFINAVRANGPGHVQQAKRLKRAKRAAAPTV